MHPYVLVQAILLLRHAGLSWAFLGVPMRQAGIETPKLMYLHRRMGPSGQGITHLSPGAVGQDQDGAGAGRHHWPMEDNVLYIMQTSLLMIKSQSYSAN